MPCCCSSTANSSSGEVLTLEEVLVDLPAVLLGDQHLAWWVGVLKTRRLEANSTPLGVCNTHTAKQQPFVRTTSRVAANKATGTNKAYLKTRKNCRKRARVGLAGQLSGRAANLRQGVSRFCAFEFEGPSAKSMRIISQKRQRRICLACSAAQLSLALYCSLVASLLLCSLHTHWLRWHTNHHHAVVDAV